jgi:hypothetical protein
VRRVGVTVGSVAIIVLGVAGAVLLVQDGPSSPEGANVAAERTSVAERTPPRVGVDEAVEAARLRMGHPRFREILAGAVPLDDAAVEALLGILEDPAKPLEMRRAAVELVQMHTDPEIGSRIIALMKGPPRLETELMDASLLILGVRRERRFAQDLVELAVREDVSPDRLQMFAEVIHSLGEPVDTSPLLELVRTLESPSERVAVAAALVLCQGPGVSPEVDEIIRQDEINVSMTCLHLLERRGNPAERRYIAELVADETVDPELRTLAALLFEGRRDPEVAPVFEKMLVDGAAPEQVLLGVARAVGKAAPDGLAHRLRGTLEPGRPEAARRAAAMALRLSRDREGLEDVRAALTGSTTPPAGLRAELALTLGELGGRADLVQLETMRDRDPDEAVQEAAKKGLARLEEILGRHPDR